MSNPKDWHKASSFEKIPSWTLEQGLAFLELSETSQKKLPGCKESSKSRERVYQLIKEGIPSASNFPQEMEACLTTAINVIGQLNFILNHALRVRYRLNFVPIENITGVHDPEEMRQKLRLCKDQINFWRKQIDKEKATQLSAWYGTEP